MTTTAIIAEFNPLHKGHEYIINQARQLTDADCIVIVMSGNFTQRGDIAVAPKHIRTHSALLCGADLVIELPFAYAASSAEGFASGAVSLLNSLGFVDYLVFGSESGNIADLRAAAALLADETPLFKQVLNEKLSAGLSYPAAREQAFYAAGGKGDIFTPNNILAIEYIKAIISTHSSIVPLTLRRRGAAYNDNDYRPEKGYISASAFRREMENYSSRPDLRSRIPDFLSDTLPVSAAGIYLEALDRCFPVTNNDLLSLLRYSLIMNREKLSDYSDFSAALSNRFNNRLEKMGNDLFGQNYEAFVLQLKTRDMTAARIQRALLHVLCGFRSEHGFRSMEYAGTGTLPYLRLLGLSDAGQLALNEKKKTVNALIINRPGKSIPKLCSAGRELISFDILSSDIYASIVYSRFGYILKDEYRQNLIRTTPLR